MKAESERFTLYQVQLETRGGIYPYEVATNEMDAVQLAREHLGMELGPAVAQGAWVGCCVSIGHTDMKYVMPQWDGVGEPREEE